MAHVGISTNITPADHAPDVHQRISQMFLMNWNITLEIHLVGEITWPSVSDVQPNRPIRLTMAPLQTATTSWIVTRWCPAASTIFSMVSGEASGSPPRSPDLTPCDFFLRGYIKSKVYATPPNSMNDLRQRIIEVADAIKQNPRMVKRAVRDMVRRAEDCVANGGLHVRGTNG